MNTEVLRRAFKEGAFSAGEAAMALGIRDVSSTLSRLKAAGVLERMGRGKYRFASLDKWQRIDAQLAKENIRLTRSDRVETLSALAKQRFQMWQDTGYLTRTGDRRFTVRMKPRAGGLNVGRR
jgi:DNA-binding transcriptional ArsR family regulator